MKRLARDYAAVAFTYFSSEMQSQLLANEIKALGGKAIAIKADSTDLVAIRSAIAETVTHFGGLDIVVNNAGTLVWDHIEPLTLDDWERTISTNMQSVFIASQEAALHMNNQGRIINIGSTNAEQVPFIGSSIYSMSKSALMG